MRRRCRRSIRVELRAHWQLKGTRLGSAVLIVRPGARGGLQPHGARLSKLSRPKTSGSSLERAYVANAVPRSS